MAENVSYLIKTISDKMRASADADLKKHGLTFSQLRVLGFLHSRGGSATQKEIERHLDAAHPTVVGLVARLERNGFITFFADEADRRNKVVQMTEKAELLGDALEAGRRRAYAELTRGLSEAELAELSRLLNILASNVE